MSIVPPRPPSQSSSKSQGIIRKFCQHLKHHLSKFSSKKEILSIGKYIIATVAPLAVLLVVACILLLVEESTRSWEDASTQETLAKADAVYRLISKLQIERGSTCVYLTARMTDDERSEELQKVFIGRKATDSVLQDLSEQGILEKNFQSELSKFRHEILKKGTHCSQNLKWYTAEINHFIINMHMQVKGNDAGEFWSTISGYQAFVVATDLIGLLRARGAAAFIDGYFLTKQDYTEFCELSGGAHVLLRFAHQLSGKFVDGNKLFLSSLFPAHLMKSLNDMKQSLLSSIETDKIANLSATKLAMGTYWFQNITQYLTLLSEDEYKVFRGIRKTLDQQIHYSNAIFYAILSSILILGTMCCGLLAYCWKKVRTLLKSIQNFADELHDKTDELAAERKRMNVLLLQMLPKPIADALKHNEQVAPTLYKEVTILFSDIKGFTALSSRSKPIEVVELLNHLYTSCDEILNLYDCYKVETIGDSYMVVSGCPVMNEFKHSAEVATIALDFLRMMQGFTVPHKPDEILLMRIGIHTGSCAAGVVGRKMPRYCLFGDTVNVASRMESTGVEKQIQLSDATHLHLTNHFPGIFETVPRGSVFVKGKGDMNTHWLIGKQDFAFMANVEDHVLIV